MPDFFMQTFTGKAFDPMNPVVDDINIEDIAHALSNTCRYGGHSKHFYSVAEHSVLVARCVSQENKLWGLLHDATEAYMADLIHPLKRQMPEYVAAEDNLMLAICWKFGLESKEPDEVKRVDLNIVVDEKNQLLGPQPRPWPAIDDLAPLGVRVDLWSPRVAEQSFIREFRRLTV